MAPVLSQKKDIILFDGVCNFCNSYVNYIIAHDQNDRFTFAPLDSETALILGKRHSVDFKAINSIIVIYGNTYLTQSDAIIYILKHLNRWTAILANVSYLLPAFARNKLYTCFANNRYRLFGQSNSCVIPTEKVRLKFLK
ncbi:thiol-disulfide oxidoreductase DCC family protein [Pedobacter sp. N23S346]|uniref:thiol-disulfide oxidoreductase DCC family protein n=1 Tax=Pedobacter sp. N23S346 TaxID=3402750 RepID=UPI003AD0C1A4